VQKKKEIKKKKGRKEESCSNEKTKWSYEVGGAGGAPPFLRGSLRKKAKNQDKKPRKNGEGKNTF